MNTPVYLSDEEARLFTQFMKNHNLVKRLDEAGFFGLCDSRVEILVDSFGRVGDIYVHVKHKGSVARD